MEYEKKGTSFEDQVFELINEGGEGISMFEDEKEMDVFDAIQKDAMESRAHNTISRLIEKGYSMENASDIAFQRHGFSVNNLGEVEQFLENYKPNVSRDLIKSDADKAIYDHVFFGDSEDSDAHNARYKQLIQESGREYGSDFNLYDILGYGQ